MPGGLRFKVGDCNGGIKFLSVADTSSLSGRFCSDGSQNGPCSNADESTSSPCTGDRRKQKAR